MSRLIYFGILVFIISMILGACAAVDPTIVYEVVRLQITTTPRPSSTPEPTATETPTPTPTAVPALVHQYPRNLFFSEPIPQGNAPCGFIDWLDFPLDPPDAENALGGGDFGIYRRRYDKYHAGEDWRLENRNFGQPVYSIGHGLVTYAEPLGWGADKGVVILEHRFSDGNSILSFYGHLDPPSVVLNAGDCVTRGEGVGRIGRPRSSPHLHFEVRAHMPVSPGPGYWSVDPALAGWRPPSSYIWNYRIGLQPGVVWVFSPGGDRVESLGFMDSDTFIALRDQELIGVDVGDGATRWNIPISDTNVSLDVAGQRVFFANQFGVIESYNLPEIVGDSPFGEIEVSLEPSWNVEIDTIGIPELIPLPGGGVVLAVRGGLDAVSSDGALLWQLESDDPIIDWSLDGEDLIFTTRGDMHKVWKAGNDGLLELFTGISGRPAIINDQLFIYDLDGIYRLDLEAASVELVYPLSTAYPYLGDMVPLSGGGLLLAHMDKFDGRLIAVDADGTARWERSFIDAGPGRPRLFVHDEKIFLLLEDMALSGSEVSLFLIDQVSGDLNRVFTGGTRDPGVLGTRLFPLGDDRLLVHIGGGSIVLLDVELALEAVVQAANASSRE